MVCDFGDVVVVPFPFVEAAGEKRRPSVVLSHRAFNAVHAHSVLAMITSAARSRWPSDIAITDLSIAGLPRPCVVRWKLFTLPNALLLKQAGSLGPADRDCVLATARAVLP